MKNSNGNQTGLTPTTCVQRLLCSLLLRGSAAPENKTGSRDCCNGKEPQGISAYATHGCINACGMRARRRAQVAAGGGDCAALLLWTCGTFVRTCLLVPLRSGGAACQQSRPPNRCRRADIFQSGGQSPPRTFRRGHTDSGCRRCT